MYMLLCIATALSSTTSVHMSVSNPLWCFIKMVSYCGINNKTVSIYVGAVAFTQCLSPLPCSVVLIDTVEQHSCEDVLGGLAVTPLCGQNHSRVCHLILHKPSRLREYVSDVGSKNVP